jgi:hypothetical protein
MNAFGWILIAVVAVVLLGWIGLRIRPRSFDPLPAAPAPSTVPLPADLPAPVKTFYDQVYGEEIPVIGTAVVSGQARLRVMGITFPSRFRFVHEAGRNYHHAIDAAFFGFPIMKVREYYVDGHGRLELPFGITEGEPNVDQGANLGLWGESMWFPAVFLTDPRVRWEAVDDVTAFLLVPFGAETQRFTVRFDPDTGLPWLMEAMRYKGAESDEKILWLNQVLSWDTIDGQITMAKASVIWLDEGTPWAVFEVEELKLNGDVRRFFRQ